MDLYTKPFKQGESRPDGAYLRKYVRNFDFESLWCWEPQRKATSSVRRMGSQNPKHIVEPWVHWSERCCRGCNFSGSLVIYNTWIHIYIPFVPKRLAYIFLVFHFYPYWQIFLCVIYTIYRDGYFRKLIKIDRLTSLAVIDGPSIWRQRAIQLRSWKIIAGHKQNVYQLLTTSYVFSHEHSWYNIPQMFEGN